MKTYTIFTQDELWDMLDGKEVVSVDTDGTRHVYISEKGYNNLKYSFDEDYTDDD